MKHFLRLVIATVVAALFSVASKQVLAHNKIRLAMVGPATTYLLPYFVAMRKGYVAGVEVEEIYVSGDANSLRALLSKDADVIMLGASGTLLAVEQGAGVKAIGSVQPIQDYNLITAPNGPKDIKGLEGKVFATTGPGNIPDVLSRLLLKKHNVDVSGMQFIAVTGGHAGMFNAIAGGRAAGALVNTITAEQGAEKGQCKVLVRVAKELPDFGYAYTVTRQDVIADPKLAPQLAALVKGMMQGSRYTMKNPDEATEILREKIHDLDSKFLRRVVGQLNDSKVWGVNGGIERQMVTQTINVYHDAGLLKAPVAVDKAFDYRFVDAALKALGKF